MNSIVEHIAFKEGTVKVGVHQPMVYESFC